MVFPLESLAVSIGIAYQKYIDRGQINLGQAILVSR